MSGVIDWIKGNLLIVICLVIAVAIPPVAWVFSSKWNTAVHAEAEQEFKKLDGNIRSAARASYVLPKVRETEEEISVDRAPNGRVTSFFKEQLEARQEQVDRVTEAALTFNRRERELLDPELLPELPANLSRRGDAVFRLAVAIAGDVGQGGPIYERLIERHGGGAPLDPVELSYRLDDFSTEETERLTSASASASLSQEQQREVAEKVVQRRLGEYAAHARQLSFYATPESFLAAPDDRSSSSPPIWDPEGATEQAAADVFRWQWDYWVIDDILAAVSLANTGAGGTPMIVEDAPIKRVVSVLISPIPAGAAPGGEDEPGRGPRGGAAGAGGQSHTGRSPASGNETYDTRVARVSLVVDGERLPVVFDALASVNFMTVVGLQVNAVDPWAEMAEGFYYGTAPVCRVDLEIETNWLRGWMTEYMPQAIHDRLGIVTPDSAEGDEAFAEP